MCVRQKTSLKRALSVQFFQWSFHGTSMQNSVVGRFKHLVKPDKFVFVYFRRKRDRIKTSVIGI